VGEGGVPEILYLEKQVENQRQLKKELEERNASLSAEVEDLKQGYGAIEERARSELGMIHKDEQFYQIIQSSSSAANPNSKSQ